jgi:hypothetical protein
MGANSNINLTFEPGVLIVKIAPKPVKPTLAQPDAPIGTGLKILLKGGQVVLRMLIDKPGMNTKAVIEAFILGGNAGDPLPVSAANSGNDQM